MIKSDITKERVLELIEAYGAEPGAWPEEEREAAAALVKRQPEVFAEAIALARTLDEIFAVQLDPTPSTELAERILANAPKANSSETTWFSLAKLSLPSGLRWPTGAALASMAMGIIGGYAYAASGTISYDEADEIYYSAFGYELESPWLMDEVTQ